MSAAAAAAPLRLRGTSASRPRRRRDPVFGLIRAAAELVHVHHPRKGRPVPMLEVPAPTRALSARTVFDALGENRLRDNFSSVGPPASSSSVLENRPAVAQRADLLREARGRGDDDLASVLGPASTTGGRGAEDRARRLDERLPRQERPPTAAAARPTRAAAPSAAASRRRRGRASTFATPRRDRVYVRYAATADRRPPSRRVRRDPASDASRGTSRGGLAASPRPRVRYRSETPRGRGATRSARDSPASSPAAARTARRGRSAPACPPPCPSPSRPTS